MEEVEKLELLKLNLQRTGSKLDPLLLQMLHQADGHIRQAGITPRDTPGDNGLQIDYAAYLYRRRTDPEMEMPRSLKWDLTNRLISEKGGGAHDSG